MPDRDYGSFHLIDSGVPHSGAISLRIRRSASISEVFRTISRQTRLEQLLICTVKMVGDRSFLGQTRKERGSAWRRFILTTALGLMLKLGNTITRREWEEDH